MIKKLKKFEEVCKKKFSDGSFGVLTSIFNPAYPSFKYVFFIFLIIRTISYLSRLDFCNPAIHVEFFMGLITIFMSFVINACFASNYTVMSEPMGSLMPLIGFTVFTTLLVSSLGIWENVSSAYYVLSGIDLMFFFYTVYIRVKEIKYNRDPEKYLLKHDFEKKEYDEFINTIDEVGYLCDHMFDGLNGYETNILMGPFYHVEVLFRSSYTYIFIRWGINNEYLFSETVKFIKDLYYLLKAYKKTKPSNNPEYLEKVKDSINDFYETINNRNENMAKEKFMGAMEKFKVRVGGI